MSRAQGLTVELPRELARSRRHDHQFSLILLRDEGRDSDGRLAGVIDRLALRLRLSDLLIHLDDDQLLVACPETTEAGAGVLRTSLVALVAAEGIDVRASTATFPTSALTASELLRACEDDADDAVADAVADAADAWDGQALEVLTKQGRRR